LNLIWQDQAQTGTVNKKTDQIFRRNLLQLKQHMKKTTSEGRKIYGIEYEKGGLREKIKLGFW
jgi:hypothetical protein